ncbi:LysR family transcriptional regulator [Sphingobium estronivorans]|uniref:LysR family transcriptional regulator n=1 Tax=Sphingobium estronivorans TaxID=1577690 RepID=UPI0012391411|nr:LysR family transcriptional regulator [Sphingobium estronivorans]
MSARKPLGLRALMSFSRIMRTGSATAAGRELGLSQPAVSRIIAGLEDDLGFELFYRDRGRLIPTKDALELAEEVDLALAGIARVETLAQDICDMTTGELRLVAPPSFTQTVLPDIAVRFLKDYPGVRLRIDSRSAETASRMIATRVADGGFVKLPVDERELRIEQVIPGGTVCVLPPGHPLSGETELTPALIDDHPLVLLGSGRIARQQIDNAFREARRQPNVVVETHTVGSACALAERGLGIAIVSELMVPAQSQIRPFRPDIRQDYAFVVSAMAPASRLANAFMETALLADQTGIRRQEFRK